MANKQVLDTPNVTDKSPRTGEAKGKPDSNNPLSNKSANKPFKLLCSQASRYSGSVVGDGHCVSLIKTCSQDINTDRWRPGKKVLNLKQSHIKPGTVIATFRNGRYPNVTGWHAAVYISHNKNGIWVWDQWKGKAVHKRFIRLRRDRADAGNSAQHYRVVMIP